MTEKGGLGEWERHREAKKMTVVREREGEAGRDWDAGEGQHRPKGPGLTAAPALGAAGRIWRFRRVLASLSVSLLPFLLHSSDHLTHPPKRTDRCLTALTT